MTILNGLVVDWRMIIQSLDDPNTKKVHRLNPNPAYAGFIAWWP